MAVEPGRAGPQKPRQRALTGTPFRREGTEQAVSGFTHFDDERPEPLRITHKELSTTNFFGPIVTGCFGETPDLQRFVETIEATWISAQDHRVGGVER